MKERTLARLKALDSRARRKGLSSLDPARNELIAIGTEVDGNGSVTKNSYGVLNLSWQAEQHSEWADSIASETEELRWRIKQVHKVPLRFLIWVGMGGSAEDKSMYNATGLLKHAPRCYVLDSTDPAKLKAILEDMKSRSSLSLATVLKSTLVVGMAMGMTSYEPVENLTRLAQLYERCHVNSRPNFLSMTLPDSLLDQFARGREYARIEVQPDSRNSTAGGHTGPLTRGSLYPLSLAKTDLRPWIQDTQLTEDEIYTAWRLSSFIHSQGIAGRDKLTLLLPKVWSGASLWTKQNFEASLGKCEKLGVKIAIDEKVRLANYRSPKDALQDRAFLAVQIKGVANDDAQKILALRRAGYPTAVATLASGSGLSRYMQFIHYTVFGVARLRGMNFVTQPGVELTKSIAKALHQESLEAGGIEKTREWIRFVTSPRQSRSRGGITLHYDRLLAEVPEGVTAPEQYAGMIEKLAANRQIEYGELTFFGDTRYAASGRSARKRLDQAGEQLFRAKLKMPVDIYEGPAMNHSYHEMIIGHGRCFSTILISEKPECFAEAGCTADYHRAQFLATQMALAERGRPVVALTLRDLEEPTLRAMEEFFRQAAAHLKKV